MLPLRALSPLLLVVLARPWFPSDAPTAGEAWASVAGVSLLGVDGLEASLGARLEDGVRVLAYTGVGCPIAQKYAPRLQALSEEYAQRGVRFLVVDANPLDDREALAREAAELGLRLPVVKDVRQELTRALDVQTTTEVLVYAADGSLAYRGAIDDQYALGASKPEPTRRYLADALEATLAGKAAETTATEAPGCKITRLEDETELPEAITWSRHVARIVAENCEVCHRTGQVAPFALQTYEQAKGWSAMIQEVVEQRRMPPWNADPKFRGHFANERSLTTSEREQLLAWIRDGMPRGNATEDPAPREWPTGWRMGTPDVVFEMQATFEGLDRDGEPLPAEGFRVPREGTVDYKYFQVKTDFPEDRWIRALEVQPGAADVVHHVIVLADDPAAPMDERRQATLFRNYLAAYAPGDFPAEFPEGYAKKLPAHATLLFQLHYTPNGKERFDRSRVAFRFWDEAPLFEVRTESVLNEEFQIPAGAENYEVRAERELLSDTGVLVLAPHMHTRGKDFRYLAHYPDGSSEELLAVDFDFNWQESYVLRDPLLLPGGTRLEVIGHFDNSASNPNNPDPTAVVGFGEQTWDEMFIGFYDRVIPLD